MGTEAFNIGGSSGSSFLNNIWDQDMNLNYYWNYSYPLASMGWGSTSDQIELKDGDVVALGHFSGWSFYNDPSSIFNSIVTGPTSYPAQVEAKRGDKVNLSVYHHGPDNSGNYTTAHNPVSYQPNVWLQKYDKITTNPEDGTWISLGKAGLDGEITVDTTDLEGGEYLVALAGQYGEQNKFDICSTPGGIRLTVKDPVEISFNKGEGSGEMDSVTIERGTEYILPQSTFIAPAKKQFKCWSINGQEKAVGDKIKVNAKTEIKAIYEPIPLVTITFDKGEGTGEMQAVTVDKGSEYTLPESTFKAPANKEFKAWEVNGIEKAKGDVIAVDEDITVKAIWTDKETGTTPGVTPGTKQLKVVTEGYNDRSTVAKGSKVIYIIGDSTKAVFRIVGDDLSVDDLESVLLDGQMVDRINYSVRKGSIIVSFKKSYVDSLNPGTHKLTFNTTKGIAYAELVVKQKGETSVNTDKNKKNPIRTGDASNFAIYTLIAITALGTVCMVASRRKRNIR